MKPIASLATALGLLGACSAGAREPAHATPEPTSNTPPAPSPRVPTADESLAALRALNVFEVRGIAVGKETGNCYGPCPAQVEALAAFTKVAVDAATHPERDAQMDCSIPDAQNLQTLKDLQVVELGDLVLEKPAPVPHCYNIPRAHALARIARAFRKP
ncbi:MAG: hypothetical protein HOO96_31535 [Polyangiaceae bacterium]|nr:hypothetical protein [Polyangiaceae bacterium]